MATNNIENLEILKQHSKRAFDQINLRIWNKIKGNLEKVEEVRGIQNRTEKLCEALKKHCEKYHSQWVAREVVKLYEKREKLTLEHPRPEWADETFINSSLVTEARNIVKFRINARMKTLSQIESRMLDRVVKGPEYPMKGKDLKTQVHSIVTRTQKIRTKSRKNFSRHKNQWIKSAQEKGSKNPERDVFKKQSDRLSRIDKAEHRFIHEAFKEHGQSLPQTQKQSMTQDFNQSMG